MIQKLLLCCCLLGWGTTGTAQFLGFKSNKNKTTTSTNYAKTAIESNDTEPAETYYGHFASVGFGLGRLATKSAFKSTRPSISVAFDRASFDDLFGVDWFTGGFYIGVSGYEYTDVWDSNRTYDASEVIIAGRYGIQITKMLKQWKEINLPVEVYANLQLGYAFLSVGDAIIVSPELTDAQGTYGGITIGAAYYFKNIGVFLETGKTEAGPLKIGASYRF